MSHAALVPALTHDLIIENERPFYFRERSSLDWLGMNTKFGYLYPWSIVASARDGSCRHSLQNVPMQKVRGLVEECSLVVLRSFSDTTDAHTVESSAHEAGEVAP